MRYTRLLLGGILVATCSIGTFSQANAAEAVASSPLVSEKGWCLAGHNNDGGCRGAGVARQAGAGAAEGGAAGCVAGLAADGVGCLPAGLIVGAGKAVSNMLEGIGK